MKNSNQSTANWAIKKSDEYNNPKISYLGRRQPSVIKLATQLAEYTFIFDEYSDC